MFRTFTRFEAVKFINGRDDMQTCRIIEGLERLGFYNIQKFNRGKDLMLVCEYDETEESRCYYLFKDMLINEYGYGKKFDYNLVLKIIKYHMDNAKFLTIDEMSKELGISKQTLIEHRHKLIPNKSELPNVLMPSIRCEAEVLAHPIDSPYGLLVDITDSYYNSIKITHKRLLEELYQQSENYKTNEAIVVFYPNKISGFEVEVISKDDKPKNEYLACNYLYSYNKTIKLNIKEWIMTFILQQWGYDYRTERHKYTHNYECNNLIDIINKSIIYANTLNKQ